MIYVLPTYCGGDSADAPAFAIADINAGQAKYYLMLMNEAADMKRDYPKFFSIQIFDYLPRWYDYPDSWYDSDVPGCLADAIENEQILVLDAMPDLDGAGEIYVETVAAEICAGEISWRGYVKYSNAEVSTSALSRARIEEAL